MTGQEFLQHLADELGQVSQRQKEEVLGYFQEYLAEIGDDEMALADLGHPKEVAQDLLEQLKERDILEEKLELALRESQVETVGRLLVDVYDVDLVLEGADVPSVSIQMSDQLRSELEVQQLENGISIRQLKRERFGKFKFFGFANWQEPRCLTIQLPQFSSLRELDLTSSCGDMRLAEIKALDVTCRLKNGDLDLIDLACEQLSLKLTNGDLDLVNAKCDCLSVELMNGDLTIEDSQWHLGKIEGKNGDGYLKRVVCQETKLELLRGDLELEDSTWQGYFLADLSCGDATIALAADFYQSLSLELSTSFGDCSVKGHSSSGLSQQFTYQASVVGPKLEIHNKFGDISLS